MMELDEYLNTNVEMQNLLLQFIDYENDDNTYFQDFTKFINNLDNLQKKKEITMIFYLLVNICEYHHRSTNFYNKIKEIIIFLENDIKSLNLSNSRIFNLAKYNKILLLLLFDTKILTVNQYIINKLNNFQKYDLPMYFYKEIENYIDEQKKQEIEEKLLQIDTNIFQNFEKNRQTGENDSYICKLIRNDSVEEFISYINRTNIPLTSEIPNSIFETNPYLLFKRPTLIEYAAFYGSIQIFQYLQINDVKMEPILWTYAIHSNNAEMIHILELNHIPLIGENFCDFYKKAIMCHHNNVANYIESNLIQNDKDKKKSQIIESIFESYNFAYLPNNFYSNDYIHLMVKYDYYYAVKLLLENKRIKYNEKYVFFIYLFINNV